MDAAMPSRRAMRCSGAICAATLALCGCSRAGVGPASPGMYAGIAALAGANSVWRDGAVWTDPLHRRTLLLYTSVDPRSGAARLGQWVLGAAGRERVRDRVYTCPYHLGALHIIGIDASGVVRFTADRGGAGSFDPRTGVWAIN